MTDLLAALLILAGIGFMLVSVIGILRMPDVYMRLQVATKASSLGAGCLMLGVALHFADLAIMVRAFIVVSFIFLTVPVSAHLIVRAAYLTGVPLWSGTSVDELQGAYDRPRGTLEGRPSGENRPSGEGEAPAAVSHVGETGSHPSRARESEDPGTQP